MFVGSFGDILRAIAPCHCFTSPTFEFFCLFSKILAVVFCNRALRILAGGIRGWRVCSFVWCLCVVEWAFDGTGDLQWVPWPGLIAVWTHRSTKTPLFHLEFFGCVFFVFACLLALDVSGSHEKQPSVYHLTLAESPVPRLGLSQKGAKVENKMTAALSGLNSSKTGDPAQTSHLVSIFVQYFFNGFPLFNHISINNNSVWVSLALIVFVWGVQNSLEKMCQPLIGIKTTWGEY